MYVEFIIPLLVLPLVCVIVSGGGTNLALYKQTFQSSTSYSHSSFRAVDGNADTDPANGHCAINADPSGGSNWLVVDLERDYNVRYVVLTNRGDASTEKSLDYFIVGLTDTSPEERPPVRGAYNICCNYPITASWGARLTCTCQNGTRSGRFVIIQQPVNGIGMLAMCELEVYGDLATTQTSTWPLSFNSTNIALGKNAYQSSTSFSHAASRAVDGNPDTDPADPYCAINGDPPGGPNWLMINLGQPYTIQWVVLTNRGDSSTANSLDYFIVGITNTSPEVSPPARGSYQLCGQYPIAATRGGKLTLKCSHDTPSGQYVIIQQPVDGTGMLAMCEVEVYAGLVNNKTGSTSPPQQYSISNAKASTSTTTSAGIDINVLAGTTKQSYNPDGKTGDTSSSNLGIIVGVPLGALLILVVGAIIFITCLIVQKRILDKPGDMKATHPMGFPGDHPQSDPDEHSTGSTNPNRYSTNISVEPSPSHYYSTIPDTPQPIHHQAMATSGSGEVNDANNRNGTMNDYI